MYEKHTQTKFILTGKIQNLNQHTRLTLLQENPVWSTMISDLFQVYRKTAILSYEYVLFLVNQ